MTRPSEPAANASAPLVPVRPSGGPLAPVAAAWLMRAWAATWRIQREDTAAIDQALGGGPAVLAFWHGEQLAIIGAHRHLPIDGMASWSRDGELLARFIARLGYGTIRGSTSRGGREAWHAALRSLQAGRIPALAVDGPRGPRHRPHVGAVALAAASGRPVLWCVTHAAPVRRLSSWDHFELPAPGARLVLRYGCMRVQADPEDRQAVEAARAALGERMRAATAALSDDPSVRDGPRPT